MDSWNIQIPFKIAHGTRHLPESEDAGPSPADAEFDGGMTSIIFLTDSMARETHISEKSCFDLVEIAKSGKGIPDGSNQLRGGNP